MIFRYVVVGAVTTGFYYLLFMFLLKIILSPFLVAVSAAYLGFVASNFLMHRYFTFGINDDAYQGDFIRYIILLIVNYGITVLINLIAQKQQLSATAGFVCAVLVTATIGFFASKHWVFKER